MKVIALVTTVALAFASSTAARADDSPISLGDEGSGNACINGNWMIVGFSSYEDCVDTLGPPSGPSKGDPNSGSIPLPEGLVCVADFGTRIPGINGC